jgi:hypothetical protein
MNSLNLVSRLLCAVQCAAICLIAAGSAAAAGPTTWSVPGDFSTIQAAINAASPGDTILVGPGTYAESLEFGGKNVTIRSTAGPATTTIHPTSGRCVDMGPGGALIGFTLTGGAAAWGAGVNTSGTGSLIQGNIITSCTQGGGYYGAAIAGNGASPTILQNIIENNNADGQFLSGAVSFVNSSSPTIEDNIFENNNCRAINLSIPAGNHPLVENNTIVGNTVGVRVDARIPTSTDDFRNNLIYNNGTGLEIDFGSASDLPTWQYNLVYDNGMNYEGTTDLTGTEGNISEDPKFVNPASDFHLRPGSPAIDAGTSLGAPSVDFDGNPRPYPGNAEPSIGAYEAVPEPGTLVLLGAVGAAVALGRLASARRRGWPDRLGVAAKLEGGMST